MTRLLQDLENKEELKQAVQAVVRLYHQFLQENDVTQETVNANILWKWPGYLQANKTCKS
jgi:hypothetical protein